jgi:hypothetical protein
LSIPLPLAGALVKWTAWEKLAMRKGVGKCAKGRVLVSMTLQGAAWVGIRMSRLFCSRTLVDTEEVGGLTRMKKDMVTTSGFK